MCLSLFQFFSLFQALPRLQVFRVFCFPVFLKQTMISRYHEIQLLLNEIVYNTSKINDYPNYIRIDSIFWTLS